MNGRTIALFVLGALALGLIGAFVLRQAGIVGTTVTNPGIPGDVDSDGVADEFDYFPTDPQR